MPSQAHYARMSAVPHLKNQPVIGKRWCAAMGIRHYCSMQGQDPSIPGLIYHKVIMWNESVIKFHREEWPQKNGGPSAAAHFRCASSPGLPPSQRSPPTHGLSLPLSWLPLIIWVSYRQLVGQLFTTDRLLADWSWPAPGPLAFARHVL